MAAESRRRTARLAVRCSRWNCPCEEKALGFGLWASGSGRLRAEPHYGAMVFETIHQIAAAMPADSGMVRIQAQMIRPAIPQRTADSRRIEPTPMIAPVIVWVVLTGTPRWVAVNSEMAPAVSAANPPTGTSLVIFDPMV